MFVSAKTRQLCQEEFIKTMKDLNLPYPKMMDAALNAARAVRLAFRNIEPRSSSIYEDQISKPSGSCPGQPRLRRLKSRPRTCPRTAPGRGFSLLLAPGPIKAQKGRRPVALLCEARDSSARAGVLPLLVEPEEKASGKRFILWGRYCP